MLIINPIPLPAKPSGPVESDAHPKRQPNLAHPHLEQYQQASRKSTLENRQAILHPLMIVPYSAHY